MAQRPARILVVDDDADTVQFLTFILTDAGYEVLAALNGSDALVLLQLESPDVMLLDLQMPGVSGSDVLRRMRMVRPGMPVIIVSGQDDPALAQATLRRGAMDYVRKPAHPEHLLQVVAAALAAPVAARTSAAD